MHSNLFILLEAGCECAGNAPLDEVVMAARLTLRADCGVKTRQLSELGDPVAYASDRPLAPEKPVTGAAVFRHESGIHCGGQLQNRATYEPFAAEDVGHAPTELAVVRRFSAVHKRNMTDAEWHSPADKLK